MRMGIKLLATLLCLAVLAAGCGLAALAEGGAVSYISYSWNGTTNTLTRVTRTVTSYTVLTGNETRLTPGWYVARGKLTYEDRLTVFGDVYLILENGCEVFAKQGIDVSMESAPGGEGIGTAPNTLAIYAQSEGESMGRLEAKTAYDANGHAAIGGAFGKSSGLVTIYGGSVSAGTPTSDGACIGGGNRSTGTVTIYGGSVSASATGCSAAIGGGKDGPGTVTIYGGSVKASTTNLGAAIGGGKDGPGTVTIYGGSVTASATSSGAAIGGGKDGTGTVTIYGGNVTASTSGEGAAIGACDYGTDTVTIYGGSVTASATGVGPAIGSNNCVVSLGLTGNADYVYADNYRSKDDTIKITTRLRAADMAEIYDSEVSVNTIAGKLLIPDTDAAEALHGWPAKADFTLPADLTRVGANAFEGIAATTVEVPAGVTTVGANAFSDSGLQKIRFLGEHTIVDASAFADCESVTAFAIPGTDTWRSLSAIPGITLLPIT